jgi:hydrogenase expression/formation protein HypC
MCLAYPARVLAVHGPGTATVALPDREQRVLLAILDDDPPVAVGDWLLVQSGLALARIDESEATARLELLNTPVGGSP